MGDVESRLIEASMKLCSLDLSDAIIVTSVLLIELMSNASYKALI